MSDPVKCITCGAVSYNDPGKTALHCDGCYKKLQAEIDDMKRRLKEVVAETRDAWSDHRICCQWDEGYSAGLKYALHRISQHITESELEDK